MGSSTVNVQICFLWCMGTIYFFAFSSLYFQIPGLYGTNGILPAHLQLKKTFCENSHEKCEYWASNGECEKNTPWMLQNCKLSCSICAEGDTTALWEKFSRKPTLLWLSPYIELDVENGMELICLIGMFVSLCVLLSPWFRNTLVFLLLWFLYFSVYQVGQTFLWFQWDILLLEAGFLTIFLAPFSAPRSINTSDPCHNLVFWLIKWLLFRLMFASGVVKLTSMCPTWWGLTALNWHYESQCIPTALAWYAHQLPAWLQRWSVVATYVIEIGMPFLFFSPIRSLRLLSCYSQILLQVLIILTGNYNFFNALTMVLCLSLLDDKHLRLFLPQRYCLKRVSEALQDAQKSNPKEKKSAIKSYFSTAVFMIVVLVIFYWTKKLFNLRFGNGFSILSEIAFTKVEFLQFVHTFTWFSIQLGLITLTIQFCHVVFLIYSSHCGVVIKTWKILKTLAFSTLAVWLFCISLVPLTQLDAKTHSSVWPVIHRWHAATDKYHITNSYGLFRRMTGVGGRPELIIEGTNNLDDEWKEYNFLYKPGNLSQPLPIVAPHQPRLDWQMWFAALGSYQHNPWFVHLVYKLLIGEELVLQLLGTNPFPLEPPKYIRSRLYTYHYTLLSKQTSGIFDGLVRASKIKKWWRRVSPQDYTPPLTKDDPSLKKYIEDMGWSEHQHARSEGYLYEIIRHLRQKVKNANPTFIILQIWILAIFTIFFKIHLLNY